MLLLISVLCNFRPIPVFDAPHTLNKFSKYLELIDTKRVVSSKPVQDAKFCAQASASHNPPSTEPTYKWEDFDTTKMPFSFGFTHYEWRAFQGTLVPPDNYDPSQHFLRVEFSINRKWLVREADDDHPAGPEGRMWLNGVEMAAIDDYHDGAVIPDDAIAKGGHHELRLFMGRANASHSLNSYCVKAYHRATETLYQRLRFMIELLQQLPEDCEQRPQLVTSVDEAVRLLDIRDTNRPIELADIRQFDPTNAAFYKSVGPALEKLKEGLSKMPKHTDDDPAVVVLGYSHIDTMWLWPFNITKFKTSNTASTMMHLMENPPCDFENSPVPWVFLATAPQHYKWMQQDAPSLWKRVLEKAKEGRWDVNGVMWLEPDTTMPSGESLVRQILYGVRYFEKEMGPEFKQTVLFLPDCFGFSAALPQILALGNVTGFVTSKISWSEYTEFPHSTFQWRGIDGSIVAAHFLTTPETSGRSSTYTGAATTRELIGTYTKNKEHDIIRESALTSVGNGDGGGGITEEMVWNFHLYNELPKINGVPRPKFVNLTATFDEIVDKLSLLPVWDDELYLEYHRGTLTSFEEIKRQNRQLEGHLHNVEWLMTIYNTLTKKDVSEFKKAVEEIWEICMLCHFHDAIPGSAINEANVQAIEWARPNLTKLRDLESELSALLAQEVVQKADKQLIFNTLSHDRYINGQRIPSGGWAVKQDDTIIETDEIVTHQYMRTFNNSYERHDLYEPFIKGRQAPYENTDIKIDASTRTVTTPFFKITFDDNMNFKSVVDVATGIEYLDGPGNAFELYEDRSLNWPAWDIQRYHKEMQLDPPVLKSWEFQKDRVIRTYEIPTISGGGAPATTIEQTLTFSSLHPFVDCETVLNWTQHDKLLKLAIPTAIRSRDARFGIQFGHLHRPTHNNTDRDFARFEASGRWVDLSDESHGVALLSDTKVGHDVHEGVIRESLLKSAMQEDRWEDYGTRKFTYRLVFHNTPFVESMIPQLHDELVVPVVQGEVQSTSSGSVATETPFVTVSDDQVFVDTMKIAEDEDGFVCRLYEASGGARRVTVTFPLLKSSDWENPVIVTLLEKEIYGIEKGSGDQLSFDLAFHPFEVVSVLIKRK